jgi:hypothetical protein
MEQAPALSMTPETPIMLDGPVESNVEARSPGDAASSTAAIVTPSSNPVISVAAQGQPQASTVQRSLQASLNKESFEQEVGQVMGTLNSWWGGVKKQVGILARVCR